MSADKSDWLFGDFCQVYNYRYNSTSEEFYKKTTYTFFSTFSYYASISPDEYFMTFSGTTKTIVESNFLGNNLNIEHTFGSTLYNKFSKNMKYLVTTEWGKSRVYELDCNWNVTGGYMLNQTSGVCEMCDDGCSVCHNLTYCALCDEQRSYAKNISTDECVICSGDHFI